MPRKRLLLIAFIVLATLAGIALSPVVVASATRGWLMWQAHRQHLKIELANLNAPLLRPVSIGRLHITNAPGGSTKIDLTAENATLRLSVARILSGKSDSVRGLSIQSARVEVRRDFSGPNRPVDFNWRALQALLPSNFEIGQLNLRVENGPTVVILRN